MLNYESIWYFLVSVVNHIRKRGTSTPTRYFYDGWVGTPQYILSFAIIYVSTVFLESVTLSLMSKVQFAPRQMKKFTLDNSFVVILVSAVGRLMGDVLVLVFDYSSWSLFNDLINSLCVSLIIAFTIGLVIVRKHFFFLI